jgi:predicted nucleic acid-binding protein
VSVPKIVVHTDVFIDHLCGNREPSVLRQAMSTFFCYTTVFQAIELFALARTEEEAAAVENAMAAMKVLGLNPKTARNYGRLIANNTRRERWNMLIAGLCLESRLPILTDRRQDFAGVKNITIVPTHLIDGRRSGEEIVRAARHKHR